ncbi:hypothetical protein [Levilactobacillus cerevisiae]|uniref:hypothetical protein n=1 Tax=Levilactobacillus cerevisiae TaxID=1704076 RepID=UPI001CDCF136|nr:hypothetical protein [Levilactobacillus cerevisiae]
MKLYLKGVVIATAVLGWGWSNSIVGEASNYSARRANSVRLVWRHSMGRHAYHTVKGARYSKHLGVKYSTNDDLPDVTWYTDAHEKLYNKAKRTSAIYYHVKSGDGQHGGWIWRGYLTAGGAESTNSTDKTNGSIDSDEGMAQKMIQYLGRSAHPDPQTMAKAKEVLNRSLNGQYHFLTLHELTPNNNYGRDKDYVVIQNFNPIGVAEHSPDKNRLAYLNLLSDSKIAMQDQSFEGGYSVESRSDTLTLLGMFYAPEEDFIGQKGLTRDNYFNDVKIGVAVTKIANGKYASNVIFHYPEKFWDLVVDD